MSSEALTDRRFGGYARERLEAALSGLADDASDTEVLGEAQLALMALHMHYGSTGMITLVPEDIVEYLDRPGPRCICPPELVARGGFRSRCPAEHPWPSPSEEGRS
jgi:hypothetical protein